MNESLQLDRSFAGANAFFAWRNRASGNAWNGTAYVAFTDTDYVAGATPVTFDDTGYANAVVPSVVAALPYDVGVYQQAGEAPVTGDLANLLGSGGTLGTDAIYAAGTGPFEISVNVTDSVSLAAIAGATVVASGAQQARATTDSDGDASLFLDAGTVTLAVKAPGYISTGGPLLVSAAAAVDRVLEAIIIPSPPEPNQATGILFTRDASGTIKPAVVVSCQILAWPPGETGNGYFDLTTVTSDSSGLAAIPLVQGAVYSVRIGKGDAACVTVPMSSAPFSLADLIGR